MLRILVTFTFFVAAVNCENDPASDQLAAFRSKTTGPIGMLTTGTGVVVEYKEAFNTLDTELLDNEHLVDTYQHTARKVIPERVVHAPGAGAFGYFETTHDITHLCKAAPFSEIGKKTPIVARFSPGFSHIGAGDTVRESKGMAVKFYTEEGNLDLTALNFPMFVFKEPALFPSITNLFKPNPKTNLPDNNMLWDFLSFRPEGYNEIIRIFSHQAYPISYSHMESFCIHTFQVSNATGHSHFMRFNWWPTRGTKFYNLTGVKELTTMGDKNHYARNLYNDIENGDYPTWELQVQIVPECDVKNHAADVFDVSQELPKDQYPPSPVGILVLDRNPDNFFAQVEQSAYCPGNTIPGIVGGPDKIFQARRFAYRDTQFHRLGCNFKNIIVNSPLEARTCNYMRDGAPPVGDNGGFGPNYYPNSFNGPIPIVDENKPKLIKIRESPKPRNAKQISNFYTDLTDSQKTELIEVVVEHMTPCTDDVKGRVIDSLTNINADLANRIVEGLVNYDS